MFATDVAEEGIHVPNCSCVIRFDLPKTVRSYVQSRGRARQNGSRYVLMIERYQFSGYFLGCHHHLYHMYQRLGSAPFKRKLIEHKYI